MPTAKRTEVKGVREVRPGVWELRVHVGRDDATGRIRQVSRTVRADRTRGGNVPKAVTDELARLRTEVADGEHEPASDSPVVAPNTMTVGKLFDEWIAHAQDRDRSPNTVAGYRRKVNYAIRPAFGGTPLSDLSAREVDRWYGSLRRRGVSPATILHYHRILSAACRQAVKWDLLDASPMTKVTRPTARPPEMNVPPPERVRALIDRAEVSRAPDMAAVIVVAALTGLRRGELCGLRWSDVDWSAQTVTVRRSIWQTAEGWGTKDPKDHQVRRLILGDLAMTALRRQRDNADTGARGAEVPLAPTAYVFSRSVDGASPMLPSVVTQAFGRLCRQMEQPALDELRKSDKTATRDDLAPAELWPYRFHDLRHYTATELFRAGHHARTVADRLGHADPSITLRVYTADTTDQARAAAEALDAGLASLSTPTTNRRRRPVV